MKMKGTIKEIPANPAGRHQSLAGVYTWFQNNFEKFFVLAKALFNGFWLGVLSKNALYAVDKIYYDRERKFYCDDKYNDSGLKIWERSAVDVFFADCQRLLAVGIGGGREVAALQKLGYEVDGFECHPELLSYARRYLLQQGLTPSVYAAPRDQCVPTGRRYDGFVVGWGAYMLMQGRKRRIAFLKTLRAQAADAGAPLLLSFYSRRRDSKYFRVVTRVGNTIRWVLRREPLDFGDDLAPNYVHYFDQNEIAAELAAAGFLLKYYSDKSYGHAVGVTINQANTGVVRAAPTRRAARLETEAAGAGRQ